MTEPRETTITLSLFTLSPLHRHIQIAAVITIFQALLFGVCAGAWHLPFTLGLFLFLVAAGPVNRFLISVFRSPPGPRHLRATESRMIVYLEPDERDEARHIPMESVVAIRAEGMVIIVETPRWTDSVVLKGSQEQVANAAQQLRDFYGVHE